MGVAQQDVGQPLQFVIGVGGARRIAGGIDDHPFGFRRDSRLELRAGHLETGGFRAGDEHRLALGQQGDIRIADPIGGGNDHLVAGIQGGHQRVVQHLLAAAADGDLLRRVVEAVFPFELAGDSLAQGQGAGHRGVFGLALVDGRLGRRLDIVGSVEIRLARPQADDVAAGGLQFRGLLGYRDGRRRLDERQTRGEKRHFPGPSHCNGGNGARRYCRRRSRARGEPRISAIPREE